MHGKIYVIFECETTCRITFVMFNNQGGMESVTVLLLNTSLMFIEGKSYSWGLSGLPMNLPECSVAKTQAAGCYKAMESDILARLCAHRYKRYYPHLHPSLLRLNIQRKEKWRKTKGPCAACVNNCLFN